MKHETAISRLTNWARERVPNAKRLSILKVFERLDRKDKVEFLDRLKQEYDPLFPQPDKILEFLVDADDRALRMKLLEEHARITTEIDQIMHLIEGLSRSPTFKGKAIMPGTTLPPLDENLLKLASSKKVARGDPQVWLRDATIRKYRQGLRHLQICRKLDAELMMSAGPPTGFPERWLKYGIRDFESAYMHPKFRTNVDKMISKAKSGR